MGTENYDPGEILWETPRRGTQERLRLVRGSFKGVDYLDLRIEYRDKAGDWAPGRQGVTIRYEDVHDLVEAMAEAARVRSVEHAESDQ